MADVNGFLRKARQNTTTGSVKSSLTTDFNPKVERQRLIDQPNRGRVEDIQALRNRPDPGTDAFLGKAARDAGFKGDVGFGGSRPSPSLGFGEKPVAAATDQSWGVNPRERRTGLNQQFGGTDFTTRKSSENSLPGPNAREGNMPPAGSGGRGSVEPFTANVAGKKTGEFIGNRARDTASTVMGAVPPMNEDFQRHIGRPVVDFTRGLFGAGPVQADGQSGTSGVPGAQEAADKTLPASAFRGADQYPGPKGDVSQFLTDNRPNERAVYDPMSGNPNTARGSVADFMQRKEGSYANDFKVTGDYGAPGSSGMPGPGGTVNTISAEAFTNPGGRAAGDAAVNRARRDFQLRQEGNQHLASDATPDEKIAARREEIQNELRTLNFGTNQSFSQLANNKARARQLQQEMARLDQQEQGIMAGETAAAERGFKARENQLDRHNELKKAALEKTLGRTRDLKIGGTHEAVLNKMVNNPKGFGSLSKEEQFIVEQDIRNDIVKNWDATMGELTQKNVNKHVDIAMGKLKEEVDKAKEGAEEAANGLTNTQEGSQLPAQAMENLRQAGGKPVRFGNGQIWQLDKNGNPFRLQ